MIAYFLYANCFAFLFWGLYLLFLQNKSTHQWSRFYLLSAALAFGILPLIKFPFLNQSHWEVIQQMNRLKTFSIVPEGNIANFSHTKWNWIFIGYFTITTFLLIKFFLRCYYFLKFIRRQAKPTNTDAKIFMNTQIGPASFGKYVFFPGNHANPAILEHEKAHIRQRHYIDKIFFQLAVCFYFPVVPLFFIIKESENVREFQADCIAAGNKKQYIRLLLQQQFNIQSFPLLHPFFHHPIKRRIMMLSKPQGRLNRKALLSTTVLCIAALLFFQNLPAVYAQEKQSEDVSKIYQFVDSPAVFPGGQQKFLSYLATHVNYPKEKDGTSKTLQGKVVAQFVILKDGHVGKIKILKSLTPEFDRKVVEALEEMPHWQPAYDKGVPVSSYYVVPFNFTIDNHKQ